MIKKVLLLNPPDPSLIRKGSKKIDCPYFEPPLGLLYVYSFLKRVNQDIQVRFCDLNIEMGFKEAGDLKEAVRRAIEDFTPDLVGIAALYYSGISIFHFVVKEIKKLIPNTLVLLGGHYPTHLTEMAMKDKSIDFCILSEGEIGLSELIDTLNSKKDVGKIQGLAYRKDNKIIKNPRQNFWTGYSDFGILEWKDLEMEHYFSRGRNVFNRFENREKRKFAAITATRGCPNACIFCSSKNFWRRNWRKRKIAKIIKEIKFLMKEYGTNTIIFNDENMGVDKEWFFELMNELEKLKITWIAGSGLSVRTLNDEKVIKKMYSSGIGYFNLAIESSSDEMLSRIQKPSTVKEIKNVVKLIRKNGDGFVNGFFITGFPFETKADVQRTYDFAESLQLDWYSFYCLQPFPGTEIHDYCIKNKLINRFDINYGENYYAPEMKHIDFTSDELNKLNYTANLKYNFVENRNLKIGTKKSLQQAERDFKYVLELVPKHVFALLGLAEIMRLRNLKDRRIEYIKRAKKSAKENKSTDWQYYFKKFNLDINDILSKASKY